MQFKKALAIFSLVSVIGSSFPLALRAQTDPCSSNTAGRSKQELQADLDACNAEIAKWTDILNNTKQQSASYQRDVSALTAKINAAQASIKAKNIAISSLSKGIQEKEKAITTLTSKLEAGHRSMAEILRKTNELDNYTIAEAMLSDKDLSEFFVDVDTYSSTQESLNNIFNEIRGTRALTEAEKARLAAEKQAAADARAEMEAKKKEVESDQKQKKQLLADSQTKEKSYSQVLADRQAKANQIRAALFNLADTAAIPFGTALTYAEEVSKATGVRPAFLLAILTQESNLGANIGSCYVTDETTGSGVSASTGLAKSRVMSPTRDVPVFKDILKNVGRTMETTKVSCWQPIYDSKGAPIGWGGAMGAAQFIPSTWKMFATRIARASGASYANPWNARDAFFAAGIYLTDLGAGTQMAADEKNAACRYYSGSKCSSASYANTYGTQVLAKAANIQTTMIDPLQGF